MSESLTFKVEDAQRTRKALNAIGTRLGLVSKSRGAGAELIEAIAADRVRVVALQPEQFAWAVAELSRLAVDEYRGNDQAVMLRLAHALDAPTP